MGKGTIKTKAMTMAVAMSMVAGLCPSTVFAANSEDVAKVQDGTYTGTAECTPDEYGDFEKYDLSVEVKIENGVIKSIGNIKGNGAEDNNTYITNAANGTKKNPKGVVQQIIDANGTDGINAVSRATCSSNAIVEAVNNALEEATKKEENKEENTVKNNNFTGLSAVISGQAEPGSLPHPEEKPLRPAAPAASVTPRTTQPSAPERDILPLPVKAPEKAAPASEHTWTTVAASEPLPMNAALHSPEPPQEESVLEPPPFRAASSESQLDIEADIDLPDVTRDHMAAWEPVPEEPERPPLPEASDEPQQSAAPEQLGFDVQDGPEPLRYVGEIFRTYILAERGDEICIIDKHAAHERQLFEKLAAHYGDVPSQLLLEPLVVELSAEEKTALLANLDLLESAGLEVSDFGGSSVCLRSVPADVEQSSAEDLLVELAAKLAHGSRDALNERTEWVLHSISCRAAIKAGDHTSPQELMALAEKILSGEVPPFCPHGRPCVLKLTRKELEKQFGRIV